MLDSEKICLKRIKKVTSLSIFPTSTNAILLAIARVWDGHWTRKIAHVGAILSSGGTNRNQNVGFWCGF